MSALLKEIETRRARRALSDQPIAPEVLARIMTAATYAPSCFNNQPWRFVVVTQDPQLQAVKAVLSSGNYWAARAPAIVVVLTAPELDCRLSDRRDYALFGAGLAVGNLMTQATAEGLIAHPIAGYKPETVKDALGVPQELILITLVILGHPGDEGHLNEKHLALEHSPRDRKPEAEVIHYERW
jgi:nitroreductase